MSIKTFQGILNSPFLVWDIQKKTEFLEITMYSQSTSTCSVFTLELTLNVFFLWVKPCYFCVGWKNLCLCSC